MSEIEDLNRKSNSLSSKKRTQDDELDDWSFETFDVIKEHFQENRVIFIKTA